MQRLRVAALLLKGEAPRMSTGVCRNAALGELHGLTLTGQVRGANRAEWQSWPVMFAFLPLLLLSQLKAHLQEVKSYGLECTLLHIATKSRYNNVTLVENHIMYTRVVHQQGVPALLGCILVPGSFPRTLVDSGGIQSLPRPLAFHCGKTVLKPDFTLLCTAAGAVTRLHTTCTT